MNKGEAMVRDWLRSIQADPEETEQVLEQCRNDPQAAHYFIARAREMYASAI